MMRPLPPRNPNGFTLLEVAIALLIIGLLVAGGIVLYSSLFNYEYRNETSDYMDEARMTILAYADRYGKLPFADKIGNDGEADPGELKGGLPYKTLGIRAKDAWGRQLKYHVNADLVSDTKLDNCTTLLNVINKTNNLAGWVPKVWDEDASLVKSSLAPDPNPLAMAVIIVSAGAKDADRIDSSEYDAISGGDNLTGTPYVRHRPTSEFDDLVSYVGVGALFDWMNCR